MFSLRVVVTLIVSFTVIRGDKALKCSNRPPPDMHVVPFKPQPPARQIDCDAATMACYYFRNHGSSVSRDFPVHGCAKYKNLPPQCNGGANFYEPNWIIEYRGAKYAGSIKCCGNDFCNEIEEAMFVPVHYNHDDAGFFKTHLLYPILLTIFMGIIFKEHLTYFWNGMIRMLIQKDKDESNEPKCLMMNPANLDILPTDGKEGIPDCIAPNVSGFFTSMLTMLDTMKAIEQWKQLDTEKEKEQRREDKRNAKLRRKYGRDGRDTKELGFNKNICNRQASEHVDSKVFREIPTRLTDLLARLIEHGPYEFPFDPNELGDLFDKASEILAEEPSVIEMDINVHIIGNLEGSYIDLFRWFSIYGWPPKIKIVFLGGMIHQANPFSLEVIALLLALKIRLPNHIYIIRGYAEGQPLNMGDRFPPRISSTLRDVAKKALNQLPLAVLINKQILCIHSSLPNRITTIDEINQIRRPFEEYHKESLEAHLFNAVPDDVLLHLPMDNLDNTVNAIDYVDEAIDQFLKKGALVFLARDLDDTAKRLKLDLIIRAKSVCLYGISALAAHVMSLWSAHCLCGAYAGAGIHIDEYGNINITRMYKHGSLNHEKTNPSKDLLENTITNALEDIDSRKKEQKELEGLEPPGEPKVSRMNMRL